MGLFTSFTCLDVNDLDQHAAAYGTFEAASDTDDLPTAIPQLILAWTLRRQENAKAFDGAATPELDALIRETNVPDASPDAQTALYAFREAIRRMVQSGLPG